MGSRPFERRRVSGGSHGKLRMFWRRMKLLICRFLIGLKEGQWAASLSGVETHLPDAVRVGSFTGAHAAQYKFTVLRRRSPHARSLPAWPIPQRNAMLAPPLLRTSHHFPKDQSEAGPRSIRLGPGRWLRPAAPSRGGVREIRPMLCIVRQSPSRCLECPVANVKMSRG